MTCIVGYVEQQTVFLGGDSAATDGADHQVLLTTPKVFRVGEVLFGCTGDIRMMNLLRHSLDIPLMKDDLDRYMNIDFVNAIRTCFKEGGYAERRDEREHGGTFLVGLRGRLFCLDEDYQISEMQHPYNAIGSGERQAMGALYAVQQVEMTPEQRLTLALEAAAFHCASVRAPFHIESISL